MTSRSMSVLCQTKGLTGMSTTRIALWVGVALLAVGACGGGSDTATTSATTLGTTTTTTGPGSVATTTTTVATTTTTSVTASAWFNTDMLQIIALYNDEFGQPYQEHVNALEYSEAQLDCVTARTKVSEWEKLASPAPNAALQALTDTFFERFGEALTACEEAETLGDWRDANRAFEDAVAVISRIEEESLDG